jgi:hypothetical protein
MRDVEVGAILDAIDGLERIGFVLERNGSATRVDVGS